jgi:hypothetical protein
MNLIGQKLLNILLEHKQWMYTEYVTHMQVLPIELALKQSYRLNRSLTIVL